MTFNDFLLEYTGRDITYHTTYQTTGIEFARAAWDRAATIEREACARLAENTRPAEIAAAIRARGEQES